MRVDPAVVERARPDFWKDAREKEEIRRSLMTSWTTEEVFDALTRMGYTLPRETGKIVDLWAAIQGVVGRLLDKELSALPAPGTPCSAGTGMIPGRDNPVSDVGSGAILAA